MSRRVLFLAACAALLSVVACASEAPVADATACEPNPETPAPSGAQDGIRPKKLATNRIALNRIALNKLATNRIALNRIALNRIALNKLATNRIALNRIALNRIALNGVELEGPASNELVGVTEGGELVRGEAFVGQQLTGVLEDGTEVALDITAFERTADPTVFHYTIAYQGESICMDGTNGMFVPGHWDQAGARHEHLEADGDGLTVTFACREGVIAKCVNWGYASWKAGADAHAACTRMGTADYCGQGVSYTKDGTPIDMFDRLGVETSANEPGFSFEAAWSPAGAVCVNRPRYEAHGPNGAVVQPSCWASLPTCATFDAPAAQGAILGNASRFQTRQFCQ